MNQILDYNPNKNSGNGKTKSSKIITVFAVILAIFAICLLIGGAYGIYKNKNNSTSVSQNQTEAKITVEQADSKATIKISHDKAIEKLIYTWDSGRENSIKGNGEASMETEISLLAGTHKLLVKVIDVNGFETTFEKEITSEKGEDKIAPVITLNPTNEAKIVISAVDETAIDYVTYRWNDGEEERIDVSENDNKKIEFEIDVLKGQNDLFVIAVDKNNNTTHEEKAFTGVTKPDVVITIAADKKSAEVVCKHENGIKEVTLTINGKDYVVDNIDPENNKEVTVQVTEDYLAQGNNTIKVKAVSVDNTKTEVSEEIKPDEPKIEVSIQRPEDKPEIAIANVKTEAGIKEIKLNLNGADYIATPNEENAKEAPVEIPLEEGDNTIKITVIDLNDGKKEIEEKITR